MSSDDERSEPEHTVPRPGGERRASSPAVGSGSDVVRYSPRNPAAPRQPLQPERSREGTLEHVIETLLDKGLVINADITVSLAGVELLGIRIRAALASLETAARYGLDFPMGTNRNTSAWDNAMEQKETCPQCGKTAPVDQLLYEFCPWCGWRSALALQGRAQDGQAQDGQAHQDGATRDDGGGGGGGERGKAPQRPAGEDGDGEGSEG